MKSKSARDFRHCGAVAFKGVRWQEDTCGDAMFERAEPAAREVASQRATSRMRPWRGSPTEFLRRAQGADHVQAYLLVEPLVKFEPHTLEAQ